MKKILLSLFFLTLNLFFNNSVHAQGGIWTWISGPNTINSAGVFGTQGIPSVNNYPPGVYEPCEWKDKQGNFWVYGGWGPTNPDMWTDLWKYTPVTNEWTWVKGTGLANQPAVYGTKGVSNSLNTPGNRTYASISWVDTTGNLWLFGGNYYNNDLWKYDIGTNEWTWMSGSNTTNAIGVYGTLGVPGALNVPGSRFETSSAWTDSLNNLWLFGGGGFDGGGNTGFLNDLWKYNISSNEWTWMNGSNAVNQTSSYGIKGIPAPANHPGGRYTSSKWKDKQGNFWFDGGYNGQFLNDLWNYDLSTNVWTWMGGSALNNDPGIYQSNCLFDTINDPSSRYEQRSSVTDNCGRFWLFGGWSYPSGALNDLWIYDPQQLKWSWLSGTNVINQTGNFGVKGIPAMSNMPPSRNGAVAWWGNDNKFYLFGGNRPDPNGKLYCDLWIFEPDTNCVSSNCSNSIPLIALASSDTSFCEKQCIDFYDLSTNNPTSWQWLFPGADSTSSNLQNPTNICYNNYGSFDVTLIACNNNGCDTLTFANFINEYQNPVDSIYQSNDTLFSLPAYSYQWYEVNGGMISGETNQFYLLQQPGSYYCVVSDSIGCVATSNIVVVTANIQLPASDFGISISPNPVSELMQIHFQNNLTDVVEIEISNVTGEKILNEKFYSIKDSKNLSINVSRFKDGIYFLAIYYKQFLVHKKFIVKR